MNGTSSMTDFEKNNSATELNDNYLDKVVGGYSIIDTEIHGRAAFT